MASDDEHLGEEDDYFPEQEDEEWDELEAKAAAWQEQFTSAIHSGNSLNGLPRGLRLRSAEAAKEKEDQDEESTPAEHLKPSPVPRFVARSWEMGLLVVVCLLSLFATLHFVYDNLLPQRDDSKSCTQCQPEWWQDFWKWRLQGPSDDDPPEGMQWEWGDSVNDTDWYQASARFVDFLRPFADPSLGPVLSIGCGDAPVPELLHGAGFEASLHLDVAPQIIELMKRKYPKEQWPGLEFQVRDFLRQGPPPKTFSAVLDKAGIWDWLQEEVPQMLPQLLRLVRKALPPEDGVYVIATKQSPAQLAATLHAVHGAEHAPAFHVETSGRLSEVAWAYVLSVS
ncbi:unnamed protein product [Effrenium voratum]|nr:unnamed protein product [Effrenium voratum]